ncbi:XRE family transcriptional regulator [Fictibacillus barbaricus]|uniref:XRE family transcriptional regulator n=1 Tax=Fictibacillus barbaricus TaxID=182136 RepID=A0ABU1TVT8_9BACL|nr:XRE family transcriptional regulator [Fictibacillus barbaricus]MDR7071322.1 hypothetical protein [Fictibacillus barbaricus]
MEKVEQKRSKLGRWLERHNRDTDWLIHASGIERKTAEELAKNPYKNPRMITIRKVLSAVKRVDPSIKLSDLWDIQ